MDDKLVIRIKNDLSEINKVSRAFMKFSTQYHLSKNISNSIDLALDEILNNIISYGYNDQNSHFIDIQIHISNTQLELTIEDDGLEFNPLEFSEADTKSLIEDRSIGGLGIHLVRSKMDDVHYNYRDNKNCLKMIKNIGGLK